MYHFRVTPDLLSIQIQEPAQTASALMAATAALIGIWVANRTLGVLKRESKREALSDLITAQAQAEELLVRFADSYDVQKLTPDIPAEHSKQFQRALKTVASLLGLFSRTELQAKFVELAERVDYLSLMQLTDSRNAIQANLDSLGNPAVDDYIWEPFVTRMPSWYGSSRRSNAPTTIYEILKNLKHAGGISGELLFLRVGCLYLISDVLPEEIRKIHQELGSLDG